MHETPSCSISIDDVTEISHAVGVKYRVVIKKRITKMAEKMPRRIQDRFSILVDDIQANGAIRKNWPNFSEIGKNRYHCHLGHHWIACWHWEKAR